MSDSGQRTEKPTQRRLDKARKEGRFVASRELIGAITFAAAAVVLVRLAPVWLEHLTQFVRKFVAFAFRSGDLRLGGMTSLGSEVLEGTMLPLVAAGGVLTFAALGTQLISTSFGFATARLAPDFSRLDPSRRLRELPKQNLGQFWQALLLLPVAALLVWMVAGDALPMLLALPYQSLRSGMAQVGGLAGTLLDRAALLILALGALDFVRQRRSYLAELRMSKQELREEQKETEGNPQIKQRVRRLQRDAARRRMMTEVPKATVIVVNPTHYAIALKYSIETPGAPRVVAKGRNYLARRIREMAREHGVPVIENPPLAQALYKSVDVGQEIPAELYRAVAEVLAYIFKIMRGRI